MAPTLRSRRSHAAALVLPIPRRSARVSRPAQSSDDDASSDESYSAPVRKGRSDRVLRSRKKQKPSATIQTPSPPPSSKKETSRKRTHSSTHSLSMLPPAPKKLKQTKRDGSAMASDCGGIQNEGRIPPWESLPYYVLVQIFTFAAHPLYDDRHWPQPSVSWLVRTSLVCRAFAEPCLTVLYHTPPLIPSSKVYALHRLLILPPKEKAFRYNHKIRRLEIEVSQTLLHTCRGRRVAGIPALIPHLPLLEDLEFFHLADHPPYREITSRKKWSYPDYLFTALGFARIRLRSWRWNTRFCGPNQDLSDLEGTHLKPPFRGLESLVFTNYDQSNSQSSCDSTPVTNEEYLARAVSVLPSLKRLGFESCTIVNEALLPLLPDSLSILSITNCLSITSDILHPFLITHGSHLKELILDHNQRLNLSFLPDLARACPQLEIFKMDFRYYKKVDFHKESEPRFDELLSLHEVPTWPSKLQSIELAHLRKWDIEVANMFFRSLVNAAADLPHLRRLVLGVILRIGWRDRAHFRSDWINRLERVFLRKADPPNIELQSLSRWKMHKAKVEEENQKQRNVLGDQADEDTVVWRIRRSPRTKMKEMKDAEHEASSQTLERQISRLVNRVQSPGDEIQSLNGEKYIGGVHVVVWSKKSDAQVLINLAQSQNLPAQKRCRTNRRNELEQLNLAAGKDRPAHRYNPDEDDNQDDATSDTSSSDTDSDSGSHSGSGSDSDSDSYSEGGGGRKEDPDVGQVWNSEKAETTQGMCSVVDIRIDDLRPTEMQFVEEDFLDEEASGDEEWDGNDTIMGDHGYAW
ncbi:MAG: hypothetical protein M1839_009231 [Geoglossum umbratile]|nr:MAG: hypothetical protein M1839_009231 [Geoglossum umbratile]